MPFHHKSYGDALVTAIKSKQIESIKALLEAGAPTTAQDNDGNSTLHCAINNGDVEAVKLLLAHGASLTARNQNGKTPIAHAAIHKQWPIVIAIAEHKKNWGIHDNMMYGEALRVAAEYNQLNCVVALLNADAPTNFGYNIRPNLNNRPLHCAVFKNNPEMATVLVKAGADVDATNAEGDTPATLAARKQKWAVLNAIAEATKEGDIVRERVRNQRNIQETYNTCTTRHETLQYTSANDPNFAQYLGDLHHFLLVIIPLLEKRLSNDSDQNESNNQLLSIIKLMWKPLPNAEQATLDSLCKSNNEDAKMIAKLHTYSITHVNYLQKVKTALEEMNNTITKTRWTRRNAALQLRPGMPKHVQALADLFNQPFIKFVNEIDNTAIHNQLEACRYLLDLYQKVTRILFSLKENPRRQPETNNFYATQIRIFSEMTYDLPAPEPAGREVIADTAPLENLTQPEKTTTPAQSTYSRLYPTLNAAPSPIPAPVPKQYVPPAQPRYATPPPSYEESVLRAIAAAPSAPDHRLTNTGVSFYVFPTVPAEAPSVPEAKSQERKQLGLQAQ